MYKLRALNGEGGEKGGGGGGEGELGGVPVIGHVGDGTWTITLCHSVLSGLTSASNRFSRECCQVTVHAVLDPVPLPHDCTSNTHCRAVTKHTLK